jgi:hypothetical protein
MEPSAVSIPAEVKWCVVDPQLSESFVHFCDSLKPGSRYTLGRNTSYPKTPGARLPYPPFERNALSSTQHNCTITRSKEALRPMWIASWGHSDQATSETLVLLRASRTGHIRTPLLFPGHDDPVRASRTCRSSPDSTHYIAVSTCAFKRPTIDLGSHGYLASALVQPCSSGYRFLYSVEVCLLPGR